MRISEILVERFINLIGDRDQERKHQYKQQVFDLLQRSYASIGGIKGSGFGSPDEMVQQIPFWKLATKNGKLVAVTLYKDKQGRKGVASGTDGTELGKQVLQSMVAAEPERSYSEKSKAALVVAMKSMSDSQQQRYLIKPDQVAKITGDPVLPVKDLPESDWPITDPDELASTNLVLKRYPQLWHYGYFREIGGSHKFKVMMGTPDQSIR